MGGSRETTTVVRESNQQSTQKAEPTPEERELNRLALERQRAVQGSQIEAQTQGLNLINQLLVGGELPGFLGQLPGGISPDVTQGLVDEAIQDVASSAQVGGILDSGVAQELAARTSGDIRRASAEFNLGNILNLLNLAVGGQAQVQAPILTSSANVGARLAGLRTLSSSGSGTTSSTANVFGPNPFLHSFQTSFGSSLGKSLGSTGSESLSQFSF